MTPSGQKAMERATASIEAARKSQGSKTEVAKHYRQAKKALDEVDDKEPDTVALGEMIDALQELAVVLDHSEDQERAAKCRLRADTLRQRLDEKKKLYVAAICPSLVGPGVSKEILEAAKVHMNSSSASSSSSCAAPAMASISTSIVASSKASVAIAVNISSISRQPPLPSLQEAVSVTAADSDKATPLGFGEGVNPVAHQCPLSSPNVTQEADQNQHASQSRLHAIHSALKSYHAPHLVIRRVSGEDLDLETCFVNLAIVERSEHRQQEKQDLKEQAAVFHRIPSFETVGNTDALSPISLEQLFSRRRLCDGKEGVPKRILMQGRAGIGKTTLCKKLVHAHQNGLWADLFDAVLWIPLRNLKGYSGSTLEGLFRAKIFVGEDHDQRQAALAEAFAVCAEKDKVLFILDGLDEIVADMGDDESKISRSLLMALLGQQHVLITSRPSGLDSRLLPPIDLELETVGYNQQNVHEFVYRVLAPEAARSVQEFIQRTPLAQGLVNIPVQLDLICSSWDSLPTDVPALTLTGLYQRMVRKLWCKDALRLKKTSGGKSLTEQQVNQMEAREIDELMASELQYLGYLAFKGMGNNRQIEFNERDLRRAFDDLKELTSDGQHLSVSRLSESMKRTSFLHTADADLDSANGRFGQAWHFLHLTFQEYFAATWIVRHFQLKEQSPSSGMMTMDQVTAFVHQHKYDPQYEVVWTMVAGLLEGELLSHFFELLQGAPRDLIGGRHQQVLASCLGEVRFRLDAVMVASLDAELMDWLHFEMHTIQHQNRAVSGLGSQPSFPDAILLETLGPALPEKSTLMRTLGARSTLSDAATQSLVAALKDDDGEIRSAAASALGKQRALPEWAIHSLTVALKDDHSSVRVSAVFALGQQSTLPESTLQSIVAILEDIHGQDWSAAAEALGNQSTLPESAIQSLINALLTGDKYARISAAEALGKQSELPESARNSLIAALQDVDKDVRTSVVSALGKQCILPESVIQPLISALKGGHQSPTPAMLSESDVQRLIDSLKDSEYENTRFDATKALGELTSLPNSAIQYLTAALQDENGNVRSSAASALGNQSSLPKSTIQSLLHALQDDHFDVRAEAAKALGKQSTLSPSDIGVLIGALCMDGEEDEGDQLAIHEALQDQVYSVFISLPHLSKDAIVYLYERHLFHYSCNHVASLQVQDDRLFMYTAQGVFSLENIGSDRAEIISSAFKAVQNKAGLR